MEWKDGLADSADTEMLESRFRDAMTRFWIEANRETECYEVSLAKALQRLVPGAIIKVVSLYQAGSGEKEKIRAASSELEKARLLDADTRLVLAKLLDSPEAKKVEIHRSVILKILPVGSDEIGFSLSQKSEERTGKKKSEERGKEEFGIFFSGLSSGSQAVVCWLISRVPELRELSATLHALKRSGHVHRFRQKAESLRARRTELLSSRLEKGRKLVSEIRFHAARQPFVEYARILEDLGCWAIQELLGTEWFTRSGDAQIHRARPTRFFDDLAGVLGLIYRRHRRNGNPLDLLRTDNDRANPSNLRTFRNIARTNKARSREDRTNRDRWRGSVKAATRTVDDLAKLEYPMGHLLLWSRWHEACWELKKNDVVDDVEIEGAWIEAVRVSLPVVGELLGLGWAGSEAKIKGLWSWLNLWLAHQLMVEIERQEKSWQERELTPQRLWEFRLHLSLVLREGIRQSIFGDWPDFVFDSHRYIESVSHVVAHHAHHVVGVEPKFGIARLLDQIGRGRHADDYPFAASHQQHALQVYAFGHFLLELTVESDEDTFEDRTGWKIKEILGMDPALGLKPTSGAPEKLLQSFSLAALHHDVGMLLFPRMFFPLAGLASRSRGVPDTLGKVGGSILQAGEELLAQCKLDLLGVKKGDGQWEEGVAAELWPAGARAAGEKALVDDLEVEQRRGDNQGLETVSPDHSLLGAWYLYRLCQTMKSTDKEVTVNAVRAILFHQVFNYPISIENDPVAALLVICDEVFDWLPSSKRTSQLFTGSFRGGPGELDVRPEGSRAQQILLPGVEPRTAEGDGSEGLHWVLRLGRDELKEGWPRIQVELKEPDHLDLPVWQIWLQMAQNLTRLQRATKPPATSSPDPSFGPVVRVSSTIPGQLRKHDYSSKQVLDRAARKLPKLETDFNSWLADKKRFESGAGDRETLVIRSLGQIPFDTNIKTSLQELQAKIEDVLHRPRS